MTRDRFFGSLLFLLTFVVYLETLCQTVYAEGSGELISAIHLLGIAHPTGYPLLCLIGRLIDTIVPLGSVAFRVNLTSALVGAATITVLYGVLRKLLISQRAAMGSALMFAFSSTFWAQAVIAEVYTLNIFFNVLLLLELLHWNESRERRHLMLFAYTYGLACTNHMTILLMIPAVLLYVLRVLGRDRRRFLYDLPGMIVFFLLGFTPYLYLPLRASVDPAFQWVPLRTAGDLIDHITGQ
ncbi:MAG: DUF2723 domain-containing protein, partial [Candidatus Latescibacteria bacterium]|nr:DUF2723 domain-containing protein [Candidatus Latescibacterota bacterium]